MPALRELQAAIGTAMLGGDAGGRRAEIEPDGLAPEARLEIYRHHVLTTLTSALEATFPVICRLVDRRFFAYAADTYVRAHPPAGPCLFEYGDSFPDFLAAFPPCRAPRVPARRGAARMGDERRAPRPRRRRDGPRLPRKRGGRGHATAHVRRRPIGVLPRLPVAGRSDLARQPGRGWRLRAIRSTSPRGACGSRSGASGDVATVRALAAADYALRTALARGGTLEDAAAEALVVDPTFDLVAALHALLGERIFTGFAVSN